MNCFRAFSAKLTFRGRKTFSPHTFSGLAAVLLLLALILVLPSVPVSATTFTPPGFTETLVAQNLRNPTNMAIAPDGRVFLLEQNTVTLPGGSIQSRGYVRVVKNGTLLGTPFVTISGIDIQGEHGLLGIAFDPNFASNGYVYLFYTLPRVGSVLLHNEVWRYTADPANGDVAQAGSGIRVIQFPPIGALNHVGGSMHFNPVDGNLYISIGEDQQGQGAAQNINDFRGRIMRYTINANGSFSAPTDNPWYNQTTTTVNRGSWAMGFRNPYQFSIQPGTGLIYANDVGGNVIEELNVVQKGKHYGWQFCEGPCSPTNALYTNPIYYYSHAGSSATQGGCAITGSAFYNPIAPAFPAQYVGKYFFNDYCSNYIKYVDPASPGTATLFATGIESATVAMAVAPTGALYYLARSGSSGQGKLFRIDYAPAGPPTFNLIPQDQTVTAGQRATFTCSATGAGTITYQWQRQNPGSPTFNNIAGATNTSYTTPVTTIANDNNARYRCRATNSAGTTPSPSALLRVVQGAAPTVTIAVTINNTTRQTWMMGDTVSFTFTGHDAEDGVLPPSAFTWSVELYHEPPASAIHPHPVLPPTIGSASGSFDIPPTPHDRAHLWYQINVTVTDSAGQSTEELKIVESSLVAPVYNSHIAALCPTFNWRAIPGATGYELWFGTTDTPATKYSVGGATSFTLPVPVIAGRTYYWYVKALFSGGTSAASDTWRFHLDSPPASEPLRNLFTTNKPTLAWNRISFATGYQLQVSTDTSFAGTALVYNVTVNGGGTLRHQVNATPVLADGTYYWRVAAIGAGGVLASYSTPELFTIRTG
jgi:glucose/arabinose dehydrogenase